MEAKIRLFQLLENVFRRLLSLFVERSVSRSGREIRRGDLVYSCRPVVEAAEAAESESEQEVWTSNVTEVSLSVPALQADGCGAKESRLKAINSI